MRNGIAIAQATELVHSAHHHLAPNLTPLVAEHDPIADSIALERIADRLQTEISPLVAIESLDQRPWAGQILLEPDTLFCNLSGVTHLFDDEAGILAAVHRVLRHFGVVGKLAIADNAAAAWAHSHYHPDEDFIATGQATDLHALPVNALRIETETKYTLDRLGIETIAALLRLPRDGLAKRLGDRIVKRIAEVCGEIEVPLSFHHAEQQHRQTHALEYPTDDLEIVADRIDRLSGQIVASLTASRRGALRLGCRLDLVDQAPLSTVVGLFAPTLDPQHLACLTNSSIESLRIKSPVTKITLSVLQSAPLRTGQSSLFSEADFAMDHDSVNDRSLARLVDALSGRLGRDAVLGIRLADNPLPEKAFRTYSLTDHRTRKALRRLPAKQRPPRETRASYRSPRPGDARRRPMCLLRKPIPLTVIENKPTNPAAAFHTLPSFRIEGRTHKPAFFWGPERIETGWWDGPTSRRDYYRVETDQGALWWIFRELKSEKWFLHGRFV